MEKRKKWIYAATMNFFLVCLSFAAADPDFRGTWILDKERSFSNPAGLEQTMVLLQRDETLQFQAKLKTTQGGEQEIQETWTLDGQERDFVPSGATAGTKAKGKAYWLPGKRGVVIDDERILPGKEGPVSQRTTRKLSLSPDGGTLTVDYFFDTPRGQFEGKRVFRKVPAAH
jgi:hypothetical protein